MRTKSSLAGEGEITAEGASQCTSTKKHRSISSRASEREKEAHGPPVDSEDDVGNLALPTILHKESKIQVRVSGSVRNLSRLLEG